MLVLVCFGSRVFLSLALRCSRAVAWGVDGALGRIWIILGARMDDG
jgi:hypothetical protein